MRPIQPEILQRGRTVHLRRPSRDDLEAFLSLVSASRGLHRPWVYPPNSERAFYAYLKRACSERFLGCLICLPAGGIVGVANLSEIVRGVFRCAYLSYYGNVAYAGRGLMREGVQLMLRQAFRKEKLHRVEANVQPENVRSISLLRALGFAKEGFSPKYLKIGGRWRDHERWALLAEDFKL